MMPNRPHLLPTMMAALLLSFTLLPVLLSFVAFAPQLYTFVQPGYARRSRHASACHDQNDFCRPRRFDIK